MPARPFVVDADGHVVELPTMWAEYVEPAFRGRAPRFTFDEYGHPCQLLDDRVVMRHAIILTYGCSFDLTKTPQRPGGWDPGERLTDMDSEGIDVAVLFPSVGFFVFESPDPPLQAALCRAYNNWLEDYCRAAPERLIGVALLPLVDVDESVRELERATTRLGFRGAFVRPNPYLPGRPIHHPVYERLWECAESLGVPITIHEGLTDTLPTLGRDRFENPAMLHVLSHPFEQMAACAGLILSGVLERHPKLRFAFLESGAAWLPYWLARLDGHVETWGELMPAVRMKPSEYFKRQCFISTDPEEPSVDAVLAEVGADHVVWASDYPHPDAHFPGAVAESLRTTAHVSDEDRDKIFARTAARLYGLTLPRSR